MTTLTKNKLEAEIDALTSELKECDDEARYSRLWGQRLRLKEQLEELNLLPPKQ